jgi:hypothetical protein
VPTPTTYAAATNVRTPLCHSQSLLTELRACLHQLALQYPERAAEILCTPLASKRFPAQSDNAPKSAPSAPKPAPNALKSAYNASKSTFDTSKAAPDALKAVPYASKATSDTLLNRVSNATKDTTFSATRGRARASNTRPAGPRTTATANGVQQRTRGAGGAAYRLSKPGPSVGKAAPFMTKSATPASHVEHRSPRAPHHHIHAASPRRTTKQRAALPWGERELSAAPPREVIAPPIALAPQQAGDQVGEAAGDQAQTRGDQAGESARGPLCPRSNYDGADLCPFDNIVVTGADESRKDGPARDGEVISAGDQVLGLNAQPRATSTPLMRALAALTPSQAGTPTAAIITVVAEGRVSNSDITVNASGSQATCDGRDVCGTSPKVMAGENGFAAHTTPPKNFTASHSFCGSLSPCSAVVKETTAPLVLNSGAGVGDNLGSITEFDHDAAKLIDVVKLIDATMLIDAATGTIQPILLNSSTTPAETCLPLASKRVDAATPPRGPSAHYLGRPLPPAPPRLNAADTGGTQLAIATPHPSAKVYASLTPAPSPLLGPSRVKNPVRPTATPRRPTAMHVFSAEPKSALELASAFAAAQRAQAPLELERRLLKLSVPVPHAIATPVLDRRSSVVPPAAPSPFQRRVSVPPERRTPAPLERRASAPASAMAGSPNVASSVGTQHVATRQAALGRAAGRSSHYGSGAARTPLRRRPSLGAVMYDEVRMTPCEMEGELVGYVEVGPWWKAAGTRM